jgi:ribosomal protein S27E
MQEYRITCDECENETIVMIASQVEEDYPSHCPICGSEAEVESLGISFDE